MSKLNGPSGFNKWMEGKPTDTNAADIGDKFSGKPWQPKGGTSVSIHKTTHEASDVDFDKTSQHHTLGVRPNQAAAGNHTHGFVGEITQDWDGTEPGNFKITNLDWPENLFPKPGVGVGVFTDLPIVLATPDNFDMNVSINRVSVGFSIIASHIPGTPFTGPLVIMYQILPVGRQY